MDSRYRSDLVAGKIKELNGNKTDQDLDENLYDSEWKIQSRLLRLGWKKGNTKGNTISD
jgi:hypothetical protein